MTSKIWRWTFAGVITTLFISLVIVTIDNVAEINKSIDGINQNAPMQNQTEEERIWNNPEYVVAWNLQFTAGELTSISTIPDRHIPVFEYAV